MMERLAEEIGKSLSMSESVEEQNQPRRTSTTSKEHKMTASERKRMALKAKQEKRKFRGTSAPDPALGISLDDFTSFTQCAQGSSRIFALLGAGLSASSGIATFRGSDRFWRGIDPANLSGADAFFKDPVTVWWLFSHRMKTAQEAQPNAGHRALAKLAQKNPNFFAVNQNIDGLCERAGFPASQIAQVHGSLFSMKCSKYNSSKDRCNYTRDTSHPINEAFRVPDDVDISDASVPLPKVLPSDIPKCPDCGNILRPNIVFFGEAIPQSISERIYRFTSSSTMDLMMVVGTSAVVLPAAMYIPIARQAGARIAFFNLEECDEEPGRLLDGDWMFRGDAALMVPDMLKSVIGAV